MAELTSTEIDKLTTGDEQKQEQGQETEEQKLAAEAIAASESAAADEESLDKRETEAEKLAKQSDGTAEEQQEAAAEVDPKDAVIGDFRKQLRGANQRIAELGQQIQQHQAVPQQPQAAAAPEKSPYEKYLEENPDLGDSESFPARVEMAQRKFDKEQATQTTEGNRQQKEFSAVTTALRTADAEITDESHGAGLRTLMDMGQHLLTQNDTARIYMAGEEAGQEMYDLLTRRIKSSGGPLAAELQTKLSAKTKPKVPVTPKVPEVPNNPNEQQTEKVELEPHVAEIMNDLDMAP